MIKTLMRVIFTVLFLLLQAAFAYFLYIVIDEYKIFWIVYSLFCLYFILKIIKESRSYSFTMPWILIFLMFPIPGSLLFIIVSLNIKLSKLLKKIVSNEKNSKKYLVQDEKIRKMYEDNSIIRYISDYAKFPVTINNDVDYYPLGEEAFPVMLNELKKAEKFIFMEYFIYTPGRMWDSILEILEEKAKQGVEVRVMYDDFGCLTTLKGDYIKVLEGKGIKCVSFNKIKPFAGVIINNRDHRKILVIDGKVAFSGGINIADEYINAEERFGHWKDNGIRISGDAVWNYTVMFLTIWNAFKNEDSNYEKYKYVFKDKKENKGFVAPYGNNPLTGEITGEDVYLNIINNASKYLYIMTPYLILDTDMMNALILAAKRGVDVRILIPAIPDKKMVYTVSESYAEPLVNAGVKVYKYTPGFVHAKVFVSDDVRATVGTINMDYRSLYLHFECGCYFEKCKVVKDIKKECDDTFNKSHLITKKEAKTGRVKAFKQSVLRLIAPLM